MPASTPAEIHRLLEEAFRAGDVEAFIALQEPGASQVVPPDGRQVTGVEEIRRAVEPFIAMCPRFESEVVRVMEVDGLALSHARWRMEATDPEGRPIEMSGLGTIVSRRQPDGTWRAVFDNPMTA